MVTKFGKIYQIKSLKERNNWSQNLAKFPIVYYLKERNNWSQNLGKNYQISSVNLPATDCQQSEEVGDDHEAETDDEAEDSAAPGVRVVLFIYQSDQISCFTIELVEFE